ncbi:MAG: hypothetical protein ACLUOS_02080 [Odoribacter splanchnicus]
MTAGKRSIGSSLEMGGLVADSVVGRWRGGLFVWWQPASIPLSEEIEIVKPKAVVTLANGEK